jgi:predicted RNase H-like nuclease (RuvC/YqgF family)
MENQTKTVTISGKVYRIVSAEAGVVKAEYLNEKNKWEPVKAADLLKQIAKKAGVEFNAEASAPAETADVKTTATPTETAADNTDLQKQLDEVIAENNDLTNANTELKTENEALHTEIEALKNAAPADVTVMQAELTDAKALITDLKAKLADAIPTEATQALKADLKSAIDKIDAITKIITAV